MAAVGAATASLTARAAISWPRSFDDRLPVERRGIAVRSAVEERPPECALERVNPARDSRVIDAQRPGRGGQVAVPRESKHEAEIVPVEGCA